MSEEEKPRRTYENTSRLRRPSARELAQRMRMDGAREAAGEVDRIDPAFIRTQTGRRPR